MDARYENIKRAVDSLLKINATVKRKKKTEIDKQKDLFISILNALQASQVRTNLVLNELRVDFGTYDEMFLQIIDSLLLYSFGKEGFEVINFWLYEKISPDGTMNELFDDDNKIVPTTTAEDIWNLLQKLKQPEK